MHNCHQPGQEGDSWAGPVVEHTECPTWFTWEDAWRWTVSVALSNAGGWGAAEWLGSVSSVTASLWHFMFSNLF